MKTAAFAAAVALAVGVSACGPGDDASREDAHDVPGHLIDKSRPHVTSFNNHYSNIESKCDGFGHRLYMTTAKVLTVLPDPTCPGYVKGQEPPVVATGSGSRAGSR